MLSYKEIIKSLPKGYIVSYAQNREDLIIKAFFPEIRAGFYVDVGANHPENDSVTKIFYEDGWSGINIEPNKKLFNVFEKSRVRDINLAVGASDKKGTSIFREYSNHGLSTFSGKIKNEISKSGNKKLINYKDYEVRTIPLVDILDINAPNKLINFMKIDVEGYEANVLRGNDWKRHRPELICIEANHRKNAWQNILIENKYILVFHDGLNEYYLREDSQFRRDNFDYARDIILGGIIINPGTAERIIDGERDRYNYIQERQKKEEAQQKLAMINEKLESRRYLIKRILQFNIKKIKRSRQ